MQLPIIPNYVGSVLDRILGLILKIRLNSGLILKIKQNACPHLKNLYKLGLRPEFGLRTKFDLFFFKSPIVRHNVLRHHWLMPISCHFRDRKSTAGHECDSCKWHYSKCPDLFTFSGFELMAGTRETNKPQSVVSYVQLSLAQSSKTR